MLEIGTIVELLKTDNKIKEAARKRQDIDIITGYELDHQGYRKGYQLKYDRVCFWTDDELEAIDHIDNTDLIVKKEEDYDA